MQKEFHIADVAGPCALLITILNLTHLELPNFVVVDYHLMNVSLFFYQKGHTTEWSD